MLKKAIEKIFIGSLRPNNEKNIIIFLLLFIVVGALAIRFWAWQLDSSLSRDGIHYLMQAQIAYHDGFIKLLKEDYYTPPGILAVLQLSLKYGNNPVLTGIWLNIISGTLLSVVLFLLGRQFFGNSWWGLVAAAFCAVHPTLVKLSVELQRESVYLLFFTLTFVLLIHAMHQKERVWYFWGGVSAALAFLWRFEEIESILFMIIFMITRGVILQKKIAALLDMLIFSFGFVLAIVGLMEIFSVPLNYFVFLFKHIVIYFS